MSKRFISNFFLESMFGDDDGLRVGRTEARWQSLTLTPSLDLLEPIIIIVLNLLELIIIIVMVIVGPDALRLE